MLRSVNDLSSEVLPITTVGPENSEVFGNPASYLDTKTNKCGSTAASRRRRVRWERLFYLWEFSSLKRVRGCRRWSRTASGEVNVRMSKQGDQIAAGYEGLAKCGSGWACPLCSASIESARREEIRQIVEGAAAEGLGVAFLTMTLRHMASDSLDDLLTAAGKMYRSVTQSRAVRNRLKALHSQGYIRVLEITHGQNGWHPHFHLVLLFDWDQVLADRALERVGAPWEDERFDSELQGLADAMHATWAKRAAKEGLGEPLRDFFDIRTVEAGDLSKYLTKQTLIPNEKEIAGVGYEMAGRGLKDGRKDSRTPWQIFDDFTETGDLDDLDLWHAYEAATHGKRSIVFSRGLKDRYVISERSDQEVVDEEVGSIEDRVFTIIDWSTVASQPGLPARILNVLERSGVDAAMAECVGYGVPVRRPDEKPSSVS